MSIKDTLWLLAHSKEAEDRRQWAVLYWKYQGLTHRQVGAKVKKTEHWVQRYMTMIYKTFDTPNIPDKEEKFQWLVDHVFPALKELLEDLPGIPELPEPEEVDGPIVVYPPGPIIPIFPPRRNFWPMIFMLFLIITAVSVVSFLLGRISIISATIPATATFTATYTATPPPSPTPLPTLTFVPTETPTETPLPPTQEPYIGQGKAVPLKDGVYVYLDKSFIPINGSCGGSRSNFGVMFQVTNNSSEQFILRFNSGSFHAVDDLGNDYPLSRSGMKNFTQPPGIDISVQMGNKGQTPICVVFDGNISLKATYVLITVDWLSGVENLVFRKDL